MDGCDQSAAIADSFVISIANLNFAPNAGEGFSAASLMEDGERGKFMTSLNPEALLQMHFAILCAGLITSLAIFTVGTFISSLRG